MKPAAVETRPELPNWSLWGTLLSALAAQACCGLPWLLLTLGVGSTTVSALAVLKPWRPLFVTLAFGFLLAGGFQLWRARNRACRLRG